MDFCINEHARFIYSTALIGKTGGENKPIDLQ